MIASVALTVGAAIGAAAGTIVTRLVRWFVKRTHTKKDDVALAAVENFIREHPEIVGLLAEALNAALARSQSGDDER